MLQSKKSYHYRIKFPELEKSLLTKHIVNKKKAEKNGRHYASQQRPKNGDALPMYVKPIHSEYSKMISEVNKEIQTSVGDKEAKAEIETAKQQQVEIQTRVDELKEKNRVDSIDLDDKETYNIQTRFWVVIVLTAIIFLGETAFNVSSMQVLGDSLLVSLALAFTVSLGVMILSHAAAIYMKKEPLRRKKIAIGMGATSLAMLVFVVLGIFRVGYIEEHAVIPITPSYFVLINTFLFIVATLLVYHVMPTMEEYKENKRTMRLQAEIKKRERKIGELEKKIRAIKKTLKEKLQELERIK